MSSEFSDIVLSAAARAAFSRLLDSLSKRPKTLPIKPELVQLRLNTQAVEISRVKTLLATDVAVPIEKFYCPPRLSIGSRQIAPASSTGFRHDRVLIEGVPGQGKSILLRHLCSDAIIRSGKIAFFYELRQLDWLKPLIQLVMDSLAEIGLRGNAETLKALAAERDIELYFDGFDEIDQKAQAQVDAALDFFAKNHPFIKIFVTSRPHGGLSKSAAVVVYRICELNREDVNNLIDKLSPEKGVAQTLKAKLDANSAKAAELLETPLLVTLLVHRYARTHQIPEQLSDFYDDVFPLLFDRHDQFKVGFLRKRRLMISTAIYKKIFQKFCYFSLFARKLSSDVAVRIARTARVPFSPEIDADDFLLDVSEISALIFEDRNAWSFIHSSVQEYYSAAYLMALADDALVKSSIDLGRLENNSAREQVFRFAREIDQYRFTRFIEVPFLEARCFPLRDSDDANDTNVMQWLTHQAEVIAFDKNITSGGRFFSARMAGSFDFPIRFYAKDAVVDAVSCALSQPSISSLVAALEAIPEMRKHITSAAKPKLAPYLSRLKEAVLFLDQRDGDADCGDELLNSLLAREVGSVH